MQIGWCGLWHTGSENAVGGAWNACSEVLCTLGSESQLSLIPEASHCPFKGASLWCRMRLLTWWAPVMSHSHLMLPVSAWRMVKHSWPIWMPLTRRAQHQWTPCLRFRLFCGLGLTCWLLVVKRASSETHERRNSKYWLLDFPVTCCKWEEGADNTSDMTQLESHTYWSLQSEFNPEEDFFTLWLYCSISTHSHSLDSLPSLFKSKLQ